MKRSLDRKRFAGLIVVGGLIAFDLVGIVLGERRAQELPRLVSSAFSSLAPLGWAVSLAGVVLLGLAVTWLSDTLARRATSPSPRRTPPSLVTLRAAHRDEVETLFIYDADPARTHATAYTRHAA